MLILELFFQSLVALVLIIWGIIKFFAIPLLILVVIGVVIGLVKGLFFSK